MSESSLLQTEPIHEVGLGGKRDLIAQVYDGLIPVAAFQYALERKVTEALGRSYYENAPA